MTDAEYDAAFARWRDSAKAADPVAFIAGRGYKLVKQGVEWIGPCPRCGGHDRFSINPKRGVFNCRGFGGGDWIDMVMHVDDCDLIAACTALTGKEPPERPRNSSGQSRTKSAPKKDERAPDPEPPVDDPQPLDQGSRGPASFLEIWNGGTPVAGTHADAYLEARGLTVTPRWTLDLRFAPALPYFGYPKPGDDKLIELGSFPALLAAIRDVDGELIGVHRTYLDPDVPRKLSPPGDPKRNSPKKIVGNMKHGMIRLSPPGPLLVIGEGIETSQSAYQLGIGGDDPAVAAAVSLGNLSGASTGSLDHPSIERRKIPNCEPDVDRPGVILPAGVEELILLGDGDSDPATTLAYLTVAGRRFRAAGLKVYVAMAPEGLDWNDVLRRAEDTAA